MCLYGCKQNLHNVLRNFTASESSNLHKTLLINKLDKLAHQVLHLGTDANENYLI